jgi:hypothetical protein
MTLAAWANRQLFWKLCVKAITRQAMLGVLSNPTVPEFRKKIGGPPRRDEQPSKPAEKAALPAAGAAESAAFDEDLALIARSWSRLPMELRKTIIAIVEGGVG